MHISASVTSSPHWIDLLNDWSKELFKKNGPSKAHGQNQYFLDFNQWQTYCFIAVSGWCDPYRIVLRTRTNVSFFLLLLWNIKYGMPWFLCCGWPGKKELDPYYLKLWTNVSSLVLSLIDSLVSSVIGAWLICHVAGFLQRIVTSTCINPLHL